MTLRSKLIVVATAAFVAMLVLLGVSALLLTRSGGTNSPAGSTGRSAQQAQVTLPSTSGGAGQTPGLGGDLRLLGAMPIVSGASSSNYPLIGKAESSQPDLFARAFATRLLTQNYRQSRQDLLQWVQAESAQTTERLVVGLVPASLRPKLAVYSVSESSDGSVVPIPSQADWNAWRAKDGYTTVQIQKVIEPIQWSQALSAAGLKDPGVSEREVDAEVTTHWKQGKRVLTSSKSVALTMNLEGPPSRSMYGFVTAVVYDEVAG